MEVSRRRFVKMSAAASAAAAIGFGVKTQEAAAMSASIATLLFIDPITLEYKIFGPCCHFCPDHLIVSHYQPVALVEVIKGGGDTVLGQPIGGPLSVGTDNNDYTSMAVRIWQLPDWAIDIAMGYQSCKLCGVDAA
ncbi:twin-arginine translocation signal domain-containing protein, partial [Pseudomonas aeruginosa]|nr:twin-arginine translocation signal domain-containing protein [Pseudomonas aeruginosa]